ncbi:MULTISPECIES: hypothetical protein [unclassified Devosia]|jgi:hypothetical protein|uniref:hypothetical protein n=1 Tax=unclassified Devosia TaxID=196773 RepID=UPI000FD7F32B|nr:MULTISPECIES: hypothetical protein [unclassified Devosia]
MSGKSKARLFRQFDKLERRVPNFAARALEWLRRPGARLVRIPLGVLLILGGVFSFLPVLGAWMLPLGLLLLAIDLPFLRGPVNAVIVTGTRKWTTWRRKRRDRKAAQNHETPPQ